MQHDYSNESRMGGAMYESEVTRLQREADNFTTKFEHEKKRLMILDDTYKQALKDLEEKVNQKKERPSNESLHNLVEDTIGSQIIRNYLYLLMPFTYFGVPC